MEENKEPQKFTLEEIVQRRRQLLKEIRYQKELMNNTAREIFAPLAPAANKTEGLMRSFNTGMAIFDGVMTGVKIIGRIRSFFRKF